MISDTSIILFFSLVILLCEWLGYLRWIRPYKDRFDWNGKLVLLVAILTLAGGFIGAFSWWADIAGSFAWDTPPLASRMLASAGWSFAFISLATLESPRTRRVRLYLVMLLTYILPLTLAILVFHLDRFDFSQLITYFFLGVVLTLNICAIWFLLRRPRTFPDNPGDLLPPRRNIQVWLGFVAAITGLWAAALFLTDTGPIKPIWTWPGDLLSSRLIGSMLLTICVGAIYAIRGRDTSRLMLGVTIIYGLGLALASLWNALAGKPVNLVYLAVFGGIFLVSLILLLLDKPSSK